MHRTGIRCAKNDANVRAAPLLPAKSHGGTCLALNKHHVPNRLWPLASVRVVQRPFRSHVCPSAASLRRKERIELRRQGCGNAGCRRRELPFRGRARIGDFLRRVLGPSVHARSHVRFDEARRCGDSETLLLRRWLYGLLCTLEQPPHNQYILRFRYESAPPVPGSAPDGRRGLPRRQQLHVLRCLLRSSRSLLRWHVVVEQHMLRTARKSARRVMFPCGAITMRIPAGRREHAGLRLR
jgi:hypothetical protein